MIRLPTRHVMNDWNDWLSVFTIGRRSLRQSAEPTQNPACYNRRSSLHICRITMNYKLLCMFFVFLSIALANSAISFGQIDGSSLTIPVRGQPIELFDGTSLEGWEKPNGKKITNWTVKDGTIFRESNGGDLYHKFWYRDFELTFEWKLNADGNSGVKYRVQSYGKRRLGCEYQLQDDKQQEFLTKHSTGSIYGLFEPNENKTLKPLGEWNTSRIVVCGYHVQHWLNGAKVVEATFGSDRWYNRVLNSKFRAFDRFGLNREGRIFLQDHGNPVWFRKIVVTPLDCDNSAAVSSIISR